MTYLLFSVYDRVAQTYTSPNCQINKGTALRWFEDVVKQSKLRASDFDLVCVGSYDVNSGCISSLDKPEYIVNGGEYVNE